MGDRFTIKRSISFDFVIEVMVVGKFFPTELRIMGIIQVVIV